MALYWGSPRPQRGLSSWQAQTPCRRLALLLWRRPWMVSSWGSRAAVYGPGGHQTLLGGGYCQCSYMYAYSCIKAMPGPVLCLYLVPVMTLRGTWPRYTRRVAHRILPVVAPSLSCVPVGRRACPAPKPFANFPAHWVGAPETVAAEGANGSNLPPMPCCG